MKFHILFSDMMIECVKPENKPLTYIFVKNHNKEIIEIITKFTKLECK